MTNAKIARTLVLLSSIGLATTLAAASPIAQEEPGAQDRAPRQEQPQQQEPPAFLRQYPAITVEFAGGTVADYVTVLRRAADNINIMVDEDAASLAIPAFGLRGVMLADALRVLEDLGPEDGSFSLRIDEFASSGAEFYAPVYRIMAQQQQRPQRPQPPESMTAVWSVRHLLDEGMKSEDILSAIDTALSLQEDLGKPEVRFHEATGLIIARADPRQTVSIDDVVERLRPASASRTEEFETMIEELQRQNAALREENSLLKQEISSLRARGARGGNTGGDGQDQQ